MIRRSALVAALLLAGCAAPVMTRVDASAPASLPPRASFELVDMPADSDILPGQARDMVAAALRQRGWRQQRGGEYLLSVTLAERPARIAIRAGDDFGKAMGTIAPAADRSNNRGCAKSDHRLTIALTERTTGTVAFAGTASEFHCSALLTDSLPHLVAAAVERIDTGSGSVQIARKGRR